MISMIIYLRLFLFQDPAVEENIVQEALDVLKNPDSVTDEILLCLAALGKIAHERSTTLLRENFR